MKTCVTKSIFLLLAVVVLTTSASCKKDKTELISADAIVIDAGSPAADGCGWLLKIGNESNEYKPDNLPFEYRIDKQKVHITYTMLNTRYQCGFMPVTPTSGIPNIHINSISK